MDAPKYYGVKVRHLISDEIGNATVLEISDNYIFIKGSDNKKHQLEYPGAFFGTEKYKKVLETESKNLIKKLRQDTEGHICESCNTYSKELELYDNKMMCSICITSEKERYKICSCCGKNSVKQYGGKDCLGRFICQSCNEKRNRTRKINFVKPSINPPSINITHTFFKSCLTEKHRVEAIRAKVLFYKNGEVSAREIDLLYCTQCKKYILLSSVLNLYEERFGRLLLECRADDKIRYYLKRYLHEERQYNDDSLLSRWGYIAQDSKQAKDERHAILHTMLSYNPIYKAEIEYWLNYLIKDRSGRCQKASTIWKEDLQYVLDFNIDEPFIDLTDYCLWN